jgi:hypothetical protein
VGFAIGLPSVVTRGVGAKRCKAAPISVNSPYVSLYCTRTLKSVHDMGSSFAPNNIGIPLVSSKFELDFLRRQVLMSRNISGRTADVDIHGRAELPAMPALRQREPDGERERIRDAEEMTTCAGDDHCVRWSRLCRASSRQ